MSHCTGGILRIVAHLSAGFETAVGAKILYSHTLAHDGKKDPT